MTNDNESLRDGRTAAWVNAGGYIVGSILYVLVSFNVLAALPKYADYNTDAHVAANMHLYFNYLHDTYWTTYISSLAFFVGGVALIPLGLALRHLYGNTGFRQTLMSLWFTAGSVLFSASILIGIGRVHYMATTDWTKAAPAALIGTGQASAVLQQAEAWLSVAFFLAVGAAMFRAARFMLVDDRLPRRLGQLGITVGVVYWVGVVVTVVDPLSFLFPYVVLVGGSILAPIWAIWLGVALGRLARAGVKETATRTAPAT